MIKVKKLLRGEEARAKIKEGIDLVADYTKVTLGPKGRNVALNQYGPLPTRIVNDGVTIANEVKSEDSFVQSGVEMVQEICKKTNFNAGDGTTQTALLAQAIVTEGQKRLLSGINPVDIKKELEKDLERILKKVDELSNTVTGVEQIRNIATISGNNDTEIGDAVAKIMQEVGMNASIVIEKGDEVAIKTEAVKGMWFDKGYRGQAFINNPKMTAEHSNPFIFLIDQELKWDDEIAAFFKKVGESEGMNRVVVIANEIEGEALRSLALTNVDRVNTGDGIAICAIEAPMAGEDRKEIMEDIAIYTGAKIISKANGYDLQKVDPLEVAGTCDKFMASSKTTTIIKGGGKNEAIEKRISEIKELIDQLGPTEKTILKNLENRKDTMESGVGIIYAGGSTEIEIKDRQLRLEDAVLASKSAVKSGYCEGGGMTYLRASKVAQSDIMVKALQSILMQIASNAGKSAESVLEHCEQEVVGYNANTGEYGLLLDEGIIDATAVIKNSLNNSVSLAKMFLTTEGIIAETLVEEESGTDKLKFK